MRRIAASALCLLAALLAGCVKTVSPARTFDAYEHKAKNTAEAVLSSVETARLTARLASRGDTFGPFTSVSISEAEEGAGHAQTIFESVQPPDRHADRLRDELSRLCTRAGDVLSDLRITARRGELDRLAERARPLRHIARRLDAFIREHE
ncbi:MAG TPA: hypothetical protein VIH82_12670 [Acidimicrobiia bacterium]